MPNSFPGRVYGSLSQFVVPHPLSVCEPVPSRYCKCDPKPRVTSNPCHSAFVLWRDSPNVPSLNENRTRTDLRSVFCLVFVLPSESRYVSVTVREIVFCFHF